MTKPQILYYRTIVSDMIKLLFDRLSELSGVEDSDNPEFIHGEMTAYVECLELIQRCDENCEFGLIFDIESIFKI